MRIGTFRIAEQHGRDSYSYYGEITLTVLPTANGVSVEFSEGCSTRFDSAIRYGIECIICRYYDISKARVIVTDVKWFPADTTHSIMAYVAARACLDAEGLPVPERLFLDEENGAVTFPR